MIATLQKAKKQITKALGPSWTSLRAYTDAPLRKLKSGVSLSLETVEHLQELGVGMLEELVNVSAEATKAAGVRGFSIIDKQAKLSRAAETTSTRSRCAVM